MRLGINSRHQNTRVAQMPAFGRDAMLDRTQVTNVATYVQSLSNPAASTPQNVAQIHAGREVFLTTCAACHGEDGKGNREVGAPNLTDQYWVYGGDLQTLINTIHGGRQGHMPTWDERLTPAEIKILALYVNSLRGREAMMAESVTKRAKWPLAGVAPGGGCAARRRRRQRPPRLCCGGLPARMRRPHEGGRHQGGRVPGGEARLLRKIEQCTISGRQMSEADKSYGLLSETSGDRGNAQPGAAAPPAGAGRARLAAGGLARPAGPAGPQPGLWRRGLRHHARSSSGR